jgi:hypothetical protein
MAYKYLNLFKVKDQPIVTAYEDGNERGLLLDGNKLSTNTDKFLR